MSKYNKYYDRKFRGKVSMVVWGEGCAPTLTEIREAAAKEFPSLAESDLCVSPEGEGGYYAVLKPVQK